MFGLGIPDQLGAAFTRSTGEAAPSSSAPCGTQFLVPNHQPMHPPQQQLDKGGTSCQEVQSLILVLLPAGDFVNFCCIH